MRCIANLMGLDILVPDFSTLSRRSEGLDLPLNLLRLKAEGISG